MERVFQDVRFALRGLRKRPGLSLLIISTLAIGIGANTAIFSVVHSVLLAPLPYPHASQLVALTGKNEKRNVSGRPLPYPNVVDLQQQNRSFDKLAAVRGEAMSLTNLGEPERVNVLRASANILPLLGVRPMQGRDFRADEELPGASSVALLGHSFWKQHGAKPEIVGEKLTLDGKPYTVIGVLPPGLTHPGLRLPNLPPSGADVWIPLIPTRSEQNRSFANMRVIGRIRDGVSLRGAQDDMNLLALGLASQYPEINANLGIEVQPLHHYLTGRVRKALLVLLGVVVCVLLIACANVANLLLARAAARQPEMALRTALGASRGALMRQLLTEAIVLSLAGGMLGLMVAYQGVSFLANINAANVPRVDEIGISSTVLLFTLLISLLTGVAFGLAPAFQSSGVHITEWLKDSKKGASTGVRNRRLLRAVIIGEIAVALVLLTGAGLMLRSFRSVRDVDPGYDLENVLAISLPLPPANYRDQQQQLEFYERVLAKMETLPGVESAGGVFKVPIAGFATAIFTVQGQPVPFGQEPNADYRTVSFGYFRTVGMQLVAGREFNERDSATSADAVIVNEQLARRHWPGEDAIGKRLQVAMERTRWREVVGVVADSRLTGLEAPIDPAIYIPFPQNTWANALQISSLMVRTQSDPRALIASIRQALQSIDATMPVTQVRTLDELVGESLSQRRFNTALITTFALIAGILAAVGVYGVMSYSVTERRHEIGVRMALGARDGEIVWMVTREGARLALVGIGIGAMMALAATKLIASLLFGVSASDPATFVAIALLLASVTLVASYFPARRAARTSPISALRCD